MAPERLGVPVRVERLERSPLDEEWRVEVVTARVRRLLLDYDAVFHTDADELLVAGPGCTEGLRAVAEAVFRAGVPGGAVTAVGLDVQHLPLEEPALDLTRPIGGQRRWVRFAASMCKPALVSREVAWSPGFHSSDAPMVFAGLYLLHMRYADLDLGLRRLERTRGQAFAGPEIDAHQRVPNSEWGAMVHNIARLPRLCGDLGAEGALLKPWISKLQDSRRTREKDRFKLDLGLAGDALWDGSALVAGVGR